MTAKIRKLRNQINFTSDLNSDDNSILSRNRSKQLTNKQANLNMKVGEEKLNSRSTFVKPVASNDIDEDAFAGDVESHGLDQDTLPMKRQVVNSLNSTRNSMSETETGINIVSMSLYGVDRRYTTGAIRNAELIQTNFPGWQLRIYMESPLTASRFGAVPNNVIESLRSLGADVHYIVPEEDFLPPMMWRFLVADELSIDRFIVRDSDSRLTERDAAAVNAWVKSGKPFHCIRDHPSHAGYSISGGLWGGMTRELRNILRRSWIDLMRGLPSGYFSDMSYLQDIIWPKVKNYAYCSDSVSCDRWPNAHPFPVPRYGYDHVGQVYNEHDLGRPIDFRILKAAGENRRCLSEES